MPREQYYFGDPTPRGVPLKGSAPSFRDQSGDSGNLFLRFVQELPGQLQEIGTAFGSLLSSDVRDYKQKKRLEDPSYGGLLTSFISDELAETVKLREKERLANNASTNVFSERNSSNPDVNFLDFLYANQTSKFNPFSDKTIGEAMLDAALKTGPLDVAFVAGAGSGQVAKAITPLYNSLRWKSLAAPLKGTLGAGKLAFTPLTPSKSLVPRLANEAAIDLSARAAFEYDPALGAAAVITPPGAYYAGKYALNKTKKLAANPDLLDYISAQKNNAQGQVHIPEPVLNEMPITISGGSGRNTGGDPLYTVGDKAQSRGSNNATRSELNSGGEYASLEVQYALVDANKLLRSHDFDTGKQNPGYNQDKQDRIDRFQTATEKKDLERIAKELDPELVLTDTKTNKDGIPIIGDNLDASAKEVEMGNQRISAILKAKRDNPEMYKRYLDGYDKVGKDGKTTRVKGLRESLEQYGIAPEELDKFDLTQHTPVLVRERLTQFDDPGLLKSYITDGNTPSGKAFSSNEQAVLQAADWSDNMMANLIPGKNIDDTLTSPKNRNVINRYLNKNEKNPDYKNWVDAGGQLSRQGLKVIREALRIKVFGKENGAWINNRVETLVEPGDIKTILTALDSSLPDLAVLQGSLKNYPTTEDYLISDELYEAINHFITAKNLASENPSVDMKNAIPFYLSQRSFDSEAISDVARLLLTRFDTTVKLNQSGKEISKRASSKTISEMIDEYHRIVENVGKGGADFGDKPTKIQLLEEAIRRTEDVNIIRERGADGRFRTAGEQKDLFAFQEEEVPLTDNTWNPDRDSVPLTNKNEKEIEKQVREEMNIEKGEKTPIYGDKKESDLSPDNSIVSEDNIEHSRVVNDPKPGEEVPVSEEQAARDKEKKIVGGQVKPEILNKDITDNNSKKQVVPTDQQNINLGIDNVDVGTSYKERTRNNVRNFAKEVLNMTDEEINNAGLSTHDKIDEILKQHDKSMNVINGHAVSIPGREAARIKQVFDLEANVVRQDGVKIKTEQVMDPNIPDIDVVKADGSVVKERPTIQDIAARLPEFKPFLKNQQLKALNALEEKLRPLADLYNEVLKNSDEGISFADKVGIRGDIIDGGFYIPRGGAIEETGRLDLPSYNYGKDKFFGKPLPGFRKPAEFESMAEGLAAGYVYDDLQSALSKYVRGIETESLFLFLETSMKNMETESGKPLFKTIDELLEEQDSGIVKQMNIVKKEFRRLQNISNLLEKRTQEKIDLMDPSRATFEEIEKIMTSEKIKAGPSKGYNMKEVLDQIAIVNKKIKEVKPAYTKAKKEAETVNEGYIKFLSQGFRELQGLYVDANVGKAINEYFEGLSPGLRRDLKTFLQGVNRFNGFYTMMRSTLDDSGLGIQGIMSLYKNPKNWYPSMVANLKTLGKNDTEAYGIFLVEFDDMAKQNGRLSSDFWVSRGLAQQGFNTEFTLGSVKNTDTIFKGDPDEFINKAGSLVKENRFNRAFSTFTDTLRLKEADALLEEELARNPGKTVQDLINDGTVDEISKIANHLTGTTFVSRTKTWQQDLGTMVLFAPRYYRTRISNFAKALKATANPFTKDLEARIMRRAFARMIAATTLITYMVNSAQGVPTDFNPIIKDKRTGKIRVNGNFLRIRVGKRDYSLMGPAVNIPIHLMNTIFGVADAAVKTGKGDIDGAIGSVGDQVASILRSVGSGTIKIGEQFITNKEWDGTKILDARDTNKKKALDLMLWFGDQLTPFSTTDLSGLAQEAYDEVKQGQVPIAPLFSIVAEPFGLTGSEMTYTDFMREEAFTRGLTYELLEPYQKSEFRNKLSDSLTREKQGFFRGLAGALPQPFAVDITPKDSDYIRLVNDRLEEEKALLSYYKAGTKPVVIRGAVTYEKYGDNEFARDMQTTQTRFNIARAEQRESDPSFGFDQSIDVDDKDAVALDTWYGLGEEFQQEDGIFNSEGYYAAQDDFLAGRDIVLPDGTKIMSMSNSQLDYVQRNTYYHYHDPEVLATMLKVGRTGKNNLKYWYQNRQRSEFAREDHKKKVNIQSNRNKQKQFVVSPPSEAFPIGSIQANPIQLPTFNFTDFINQQNTPVPTPVNTVVPGTTPTPQSVPASNIPFPEGSPYRRD